MTTISINNLARAIYESSCDKDGAELDVVAKKAVQLMARKNLINKSKEVLTEIKKIIDKNEEVVRAKISSKMKLDKKMTGEIEDFIKKRYKAQNTVLEFEIKEELLGGVKIEVGDEIIDTTLKNKINKLENYLITN